jgi:ankyrin repeat protein
MLACRSSGRGYNRSTEKDDESLVEQLLDTGADVNVVDEDSRTPLHYLFNQPGNHPRQDQIL